MMFLYAASIGWPDGVQKIGVTTTAPVERVPITAPPLNSSGGVPMAGAPARQSAFLLTGWAMPRKRPTCAAPCACVAQPASSGVADGCCAATAEVPAVVRAAAL